MKAPSKNSAAASPPPPRKSPPVQRFDPSWIPEFKGNVLDWLDACVEECCIHPRVVAGNPNVLAHAGVSRRLLTPETIHTAVKGTYLTAKSYAARHNKRIAEGKARGWMEVKEYDWCNYAVPDLPKPTPSQAQEPPCDPAKMRTGRVERSNLFPTPIKKPASPSGVKKSRPVRKAADYLRKLKRK